VVDAALVPALELENGNHTGPGVRAVELLALPLALLAPLGGEDRKVLAPALEQAPGLVRLLEERELPLQRAPRLVHDWDGWLALLEPCGPRLPVPGPLAAAAGAASPVPLEARRPEGDLCAKLWLLLAEELVDRGLEERVRAGLRRSLVDRPAAVIRARRE
jgi:hypothetical protein